MRLLQGGRSRKYGERYVKLGYPDCMIWYKLMDCVDYVYRGLMRWL